MTVLLVFFVVFASAVAALFLRSRRRRARHRATVLHQLPLTTQVSGQSMITSRGNQQAARKKSIRERERMNLAFGVVEDDDPDDPSTPYNSSVPMPATSSTMSNPYDAVIKGSRDPFQDPTFLRTSEKMSRPGQEAGGVRTMRNDTSSPSRAMGAIGTTRTDLSHANASPPPRLPSPAKSSPSPSRTAKTKYQSTSSPIKPQRGLPASSKVPIGAIQTYRIPSSSKTAAQTVGEATKSGMKQSTSDRSLNSGYY